jgi:hypothetical protein
MSNLTKELGNNAAIYEAIALRVVALIDTAEVSLEVGVIALKTAQLILDARERDAWDAFGSTPASEFSQELQRASQA